jgi:hypothetical protein
MYIFNALLIGGGLVVADSLCVKWDEFLAKRSIFLMILEVVADC